MSGLRRSQQRGQGMVFSHFWGALFFSSEFDLCFHKAFTEKEENTDKHSFFMLTFPSFEIKANTLKPEQLLF